MPSPDLYPHTTEVPIGAVPDGKVIDFLTGREVNDTPEEYVRQNLEKALVRQYKYNAVDCRPEYPIRVGSARKRIDIAVFSAKQDHAQHSIRIIVETKKKGVSPQDPNSGIDQLHSYMAACPNVQYGIWTNGDERHCYARRDIEGSVSFEEIVDIPNFNQSEADVQRPRRKDLTPAAADNLLFAFRRCHNYIAGTEGMHKPAAFWELLKLIFCKIEDERTGVLQFYCTNSEVQSSIAAVTAKVRVHGIFKDKVLAKFSEIFSGSDREINLAPNVIAYVVSQLQRYSLLASPIDVKGVAYEEIVGSNLRGDRGEFFTPRNACRMAVEMMDPGPEEQIFDPACGTGGFLITAMNHALHKLQERERSEWADPKQGLESERQEHYRKRSEYLRSKVHGFDLNPALVRAAKMNMVMNNDGEGGLHQANSLANPHVWAPEAAKAVPLGSVDLIFTNPPFGANIVIDDENVLRQFQLASIWDDVTGRGWVERIASNGTSALQKSLPPEILFVERCIQFLRPGTGRMAMVIPNGILNNPALAYVRQWIMHNTQVIAIVDMARDLFQPKNDTQTSMIILRRLSAEERAKAKEQRIDYPIFMAVTEKIGHDKRGNVVYRRSEEGEDLLVRKEEEVVEYNEELDEEVVRVVVTSEKAIDDDLPEVASAFRRWLQEQSV